MAEKSEDVSFETVHNLINYMSRNCYRTKDADSFTQDTELKCLDLIQKDYAISVIDNKNGELCNSYPAKIAVLEYCSSTQDKNVESIYDGARLRDLFLKARLARVWSRFAVPVIMYEGKHILRSATISGGAELYGRSGVDFLTGGNGLPDEDSMLFGNKGQLFDRVRGQDIRALRQFDVTHICDLMVENKKVKFGMNMTSSEKVDKEGRYADFSLLRLPYPGCEFFNDWRQRDYLAEDVCFDWNQNFVDASLDLTDSHISQKLHIDWTEYKSWDLAKLTQNYLKLLIHHVKEGSSGILVHCISGWDRTPLFISLLRLSLWADGAIHSSLEPLQMLYLTIGYDWFLFGHNLPDRLRRGEEIFFFCFFFLKYIEGEEFSIHCVSDVAENRQPPSCHNLSDLSLEDLDTDSRHRHSSGTPPLILLEDDDLKENEIHHKRTDSPLVLLEDGQIRHSTSSPVTVPIPSRGRFDSSSSGAESASSWQLVSDTGSLPGTRKRRPSSGSHLNPHELRMRARRERLEKVRRAFYSAYSVIVGFQMTPTATRGFSTLLDHFAEKVGFKPSKTTSWS